jgi:hypothetical protein
MKYIPLTRGYRAKVDAEDYPLLSRFNWSCHIVKGGKKNNIEFHLRKERVSARGVVCGKPTLMHRYILGASIGVVDHINGDSLDNRRKNLRIVTSQENTKNTIRPYVVKTRGGKYEARIGENGRVKYLGTFETKKQAIKVWLLHKIKLGNCDRALAKWGKYL